MVKLWETLSRFKKVRIMLVGDFVLDAYTIGKVRRISPEAPVPVLQVEKEEDRPGCAGNAALNLLSLGAEVIAVGRIGDDAAGAKLKQALAREGVDISGLVREKGYQTPVKNRLIADNQQMMRVDFEKISSLPQNLEEEVVKCMEEQIASVKVIAISDYAKGFLTPTLLKKIFSLAKKHQIPTLVDPKGKDFSKYKGATLIKPNLGEAVLASGLTSESPLDLIAKKLLQETNAEAFLITRSQEGISVYHKNGSREDFPVHAREVKDVTGAGDTVLAMLGVALANEFPIHDATSLANIAAGVAIEHFGCACVTLSEVARRLLHADPKNKIFEAPGFALQLTTKDRPITTVEIEGEKGFTSDIFKKIRKFGSEKKGDLVLHVHGSEDPDFLHLLASLQEVDFVVKK